ncbi:MAG TPA: hypothetical protein VIU12_02885 [Chryseolinea sp.]
MSQPYYMIDFSATMCTFEIRINDYPVLDMEVDGQVSTLVPVNFAILETGIQKILATIRPLSKHKILAPTTNLNFDIKLFDVTHDFVFEKQFGAYQLPPITSSVKLPVVRYASSFSAEVPYVLKAWQNGIDLNEMKDLSQKLFSAYQNLSNLLKAKNYTEFTRRLARRENNMAVALYLSPAEKKARLNGLIRDAQNGFDVMPVAKDSIVRLYGDGKVAALKKINGDSALFLYNEEKNEELMIDVGFYMAAGKSEWEVI